MLSINFRYFESGNYRGFARSTGKKLLMEKMDLAESDVMMWNVYTDVDIELKKATNTMKNTGNKVKKSVLKI